MMVPQDEYWMEQALELARRADHYDEVPVGAVVVRDDAIIGRGFNQPIGLNDPTAHAEIQALRDAARMLGNYRLTGATLYVTLEPCAMCAGAIVHSRIKRLVFGTREPRAGAIVSQTQQLDGAHLNHRVEYEEGILAAQSSQLIRHFFARRRQQG